MPSIICGDEVNGDTKTEYDLIVIAAGSAGLAAATAAREEGLSDILIV
jgi:succinate dehydrogenase/fumarate reductase flavoprotein subunit